MRESGNPEDAGDPVPKSNSAIKQYAVTYFKAKIELFVNKHGYLSALLFTPGICF